MNPVIESWAAIWKAVILVGVVAFGLLAVVAAIGGIFDVGRMLKSLRDEPDADG